LQCPYKKFARSRYRVRKGKQQSYYLRDLPRGSTRRAGVEPRPYDEWNRNRRKQLAACVKNVWYRRKWFVILSVKAESNKENL